MTKTMRGRGRRWLFGEDGEDKRKKKNHVESGHLRKKMKIRGRKKKSRGKWKRKRKPIKIIEKRNKRNYFFFLFPIISYKMGNIFIFL